MCESSVWLLIWLDWGMPKESSRHLLRYLWGCFRKEWFMDQQTQRWKPALKVSAASDRWRAAVEQKVGGRKALCCWAKSFLSCRHLWRSDSRLFFWMPTCNKSTTTSNPRPPWNFLASCKLITAQPAVSHWRITLPQQAGVSLSHPLSQLYTLLVLFL